MHCLTDRTAHLATFVTPDGSVFDRPICCNTKEVFYLTTHSTHFIYGYMASDIW